MGAHVGHEPGARQLRDRRAEHSLRQLERLLLLEPAVMAEDVGVLLDAEGEQVAGSAHGGRGALGDPGQDGIEVGIGDQVGGRRVEAVEPLRHRAQLGLEDRHVLGRVRGPLGEARVPGDLVHAGVGAARLAGGLVDRRRRHAEQDCGLAQQALRPVAVLDGALEPSHLALGDHRAAGCHLDRLEHRDRGELAPRLGDLLIDGLRRAERAHQRRDRRAGVLRDRLLAHAAGDLRVARELGGRSEERHGLVVGDPVREVVQVGDAALRAGSLEQLRQPVLAEGAAHAPHQHARERAGEVAVPSLRGRVLLFPHPLGYRHTGRRAEASLAAPGSQPGGLDVLHEGHEVGQHRVRAPGRGVPPAARCATARSA